MTKRRFNRMTYQDRTNYLIDKLNRICNPSDSGDPAPEWKDFELVAYYFKDGFNWIAVDNRTGDVWIEQFLTEKKAKAYIS